MASEQSRWQEAEQMVDKLAGRPQPPSVGRVVHYVAYDDGPCQAAIITEVPEDAEHVVGLFVMSPTACGFHTRVGESAGRLAGRWHWPERV